jgi:hypothetical protein
MQYEPIEVAQLNAGQLLDRALHVYLEKNQRYVPVARALEPLEDRVLARVAKYGSAFVQGPSLAARYPLLSQTLETAQQVFNDAEAAPFERNGRLRDATRWMADLAFPAALGPGSPPDLVPAVFFMHGLLATPDAPVLMYMADRSVEVYSLALRTAALSALISIWVGHSDEGFLKKLVTAVFCAEVGALVDDLTRDSVLSLAGLSPPVGAAAALAASTRTVAQMKAGALPGVEAPDRRLSGVIASVCAATPVAPDEVSCVVAASRWLANLSAWSGELQVPADNAAFAKLAGALGRGAGRAAA